MIGRSKAFQVDDLYQSPSWLNDAVDKAVPDLQGRMPLWSDSWKEMRGFVEVWRRWAPYWTVPCSGRGGVVGLKNKHCGELDHVGQSRARLPQPFTEKYKREDVN